jgi:uncharacterized membrane protein required for colicin V production
MWLDILILLIAILSMIRGYRRGFFGTVLRTFGWLLSIIAAAIAYPHATVWLSAHTDIYDNIRIGLEERFGAQLSAKTGELTEDIPDRIAEAADKLAETFAVSLADGVATVCAGVSVYLALLLAIKLLASLLAFLFSKRPSRKGILSGVDSLLGLVFGAVTGMLVIFVLLALLLPVSLLIGESANATVSDALFSSMFAGELYNNNPLLLPFGGLLAP